MGREQTAITNRLKAEAFARGFALAGVAPATDADGFARYEAWLARGYAGEMGYLRRNAEPRRHPDSILPGVRSVMMVGLEYSPARSPECGVRSEEKASRSTLSPPLTDCPDTPHSALRTPHLGKVAAYAQAPDYHRVIWDRLNDLCAWLEREAPGCVTAAVADTAPLLERDFARRAGLGWVGKNTMLISPTRGSFFLLGALLTDLELAADEPFAADHCGTCTACLDACPTAAFPEPRVLDARRCVSYLTIELAGPIPDDLKAGVGARLFGCDDCQDVCPWNRKAAKAGPVGVPLPHRPDLAALDPVDLLGMTDAEFRRRFRGTALFRAKSAGLRRNAAVVLGNVGDERAIPALERAAADPDEGVRDAAAWALGRVRQRTASV